MAGAYGWRLGGYPTAAVRQAIANVHSEHVSQLNTLQTELAGLEAETYRLTDTLAKLEADLRAAETDLAAELQTLPFVQGPDLQHLQASLDHRTMQRQRLEAKVRQREETLARLQKTEADYAAELDSIAQRLQARLRLDVAGAGAPR